MTRYGGVVSLSLRLVDEDAAIVVGEDAEGDRRKFRKSDLKSCIVSRKLESVSVVMDRAKFRKLRVEKADIAPAAEQVVVKKKRKCLSCRHEFQAHPAIFVCPPCKKTNNWRTGSDYSLAI